MLADEPTGNLDEATSDQIIALLRRMADASGLSVVLVTHNLRIAGKADHVVRLNSGRVESDSRAAWVGDGSRPFLACRSPPGAEPQTYTES